MQTPATLLDYVSALDVAIFLAVPLTLMIVVFLQEYFAQIDGHAHSGRYAR